MMVMEDEPETPTSNGGIYSDPTKVVGIAFDGQWGTSDADTLTVGSHSAVSVAEVFNGAKSGDLIDVSDIRTDGNDLKVDVTFNADLESGVSPTASEFTINTLNNLEQGTNSPFTGGSLASEAVLNGTNGVTLPIDKNVDTNASVDDYVSIAYSGSSIMLSGAPTATLVSITVVV